MQPATEFEPGEAQMVVRIMASDYAESTLFPAVLTQLREYAPGITLDIMNPSDVSFLDVERKLPRKKRAHSTATWRRDFGLASRQLSHLLLHPSLVIHTAVSHGAYAGWRCLPGFLSWQIGYYSLLGDIIGPERCTST